MFEINEIMQYVPHRYPFLLIDRILEFVPEQKVTVLKNVSINEAQFQGHFPGQPILPGVYIIENMAQASCFLLAKSAGGLKEGATYVLGKVGIITSRNIYLHTTSKNKASSFYLPSVQHAKEYSKPRRW